MTSRDFCFWLQGLFELGNPETLTAEQTAAVKRHLAMVFIHEIDPSAGPPEKQAALNEAHKPPEEIIKTVHHHHGRSPTVFRC